MKIIVTSQGSKIKVDSDLFEFLNSLRWFTKNGYAYCQISSDGKRTLVGMHHFVLGGTQEGYVVDHVNRDKSDNRICNLRLVTKSQNMMNSTCSANYVNKYSKFKGVTYDKQRDKWTAKIKINGKTINLGRFSTEQKAAKVYNLHAKKLFKEFRNINKGI